MNASTFQVTVVIYYVIILVHQVTTVCLTSRNISNVCLPINNVSLVSENFKSVSISINVVRKSFLYEMFIYWVTLLVYQVEI